MEPYTIDPDWQVENSVKLLDQFHAYRTAYKHVNSQPIHAFFLIPKQLPPGPRPLFVRFHGGAWSEGEAEAFMRPFFLELALKHGAIILTPDYRLRPEHEVADSLEDIRSFWQWIERGNAQQLLRDDQSRILHAGSLELDVRNLLVGGESGGGYFTMQTALLGLTELPIRVLFVQYPALHLTKVLTPNDAAAAAVESRLAQQKDPKKGVVVEEQEWNAANTGSVFDSAEIKNSDNGGAWVDHVPYSVVEEHLAGLKPGQICTRARFGSRMDIFRAMVQAGRFCDLSSVATMDLIDPIRSVETAAATGKKLPPILLYHSKEDESVPCEHTVEWVAKFRKLYPDVPLHLVYLATGEHVFDNNHTMATPWLKEPLEFVQKYWPAQTDSSTTST